jgi:hypothetical protein
VAGKESRRTQTAGSASIRVELKKKSEKERQALNRLNSTGGML